MAIRLLEPRTIAGYRYGEGTILDLQDDKEEEYLVDRKIAEWYMIDSDEGGATLIRANNLADLPDKAAARANLGLGSLATQGPNGVVLDGSNAKFEIGSTNASNTPYIDFHSSGLNTDYDSRIMATGGSAGAGAGSLFYIAGGGHRFSGNAVPSANGGASLGVGDLRWSTLNTHTIPGGTGTLALRSDIPFINVKNYGAVGDGVADDTAAFTAAALAAPGYSNMTDIGSDVPAPVNVDVYVPAGTYKLASKVKTQRRVTWHLGDGAIVDDSAMLDGVLVRGSRINATHIGIGGNATNISARANHHTGKLDKSPAVYGIAEQASLSVNGPLHSVAVFSDNTGTTCETLTGTTFTSTSVTFTSALDFDDFKPGTVLTVGTQAGAIMGFADSWNAATKTIYVQGWYKFTGVSGDKETPSNGSTVRLNYWRKIWAHNANVTLPSGADTIQAVGFELGTVNNQSDVSETYSSTGRYLWGYDCVNLGAYTSSTAFIARNKFVEGFLSKGAKYSFRVLPASDPAKDLTLYGFSYEQESGVAFRSMAGGQPSWRVGYDGNMEIGRQDIAQTTFVDLHSSGAGSDYDARIQASGGDASNGNGGLTYTAATHSFVGGLKFGTFTTDAAATIAGYITITDAAGNSRKLLVAA